MRISVKVKLIFSLSIVVTFILTILLFQMISREREILQTTFKEKVKILTMALDAGIGSREQLNDFSRLHSEINKFLWLYPEIVEISIALPTVEGLKILVSNNPNEVGKLAGEEILVAYEKGKFLTKTLTLSDGTRVFSATAPIHLGGETAGVYSIKLSLAGEEKAISQQQRQVVKAILTSIGAILFSLSFLINKMIISPLDKIKKGLEEIAKGNLTFRINLKNKDEIGDLARGVNEMAKKLEESYKSLEDKVKEATKELEEAKTVLEIRVKARTKELEELAKSLDEQVKERTKELQEKIEELEKFQRLAVGRELKMIELKKEILRLKKELEEKRKRET